MQLLIAQGKREDRKRIGRTETVKGKFVTGLKSACQKWTMKGEFHDKLQNYLLPLKEKLEPLCSSGEAQTVKVIKKLYLETYKDYLE